VRLRWFWAAFAGVLGLALLGWVVALAFASSALG
jgi:hypothetical protein